MSYQVSLGYDPISSNDPRPLRAAYVSILLSEVEPEQTPSGNGGCEAIVVGAGLCDGECERAYTAYAPHYDSPSANKECFPPEGFDQIRPHSIRSLQFDQRIRPLSFRPEKFDIFTATRFQVLGFLENTVWFG